MDELVGRLCGGEHDVTTSHAQSVDELRASLHRQYLLIEVEGTRGGTELGIALGADTAHNARVALDRGDDRIELSGELTLNYVPLRCVADIVPATQRGRARFEVVEA